MYIPLYYKLQISACANNHYNLFYTCPIIIRLKNIFFKEYKTNILHCRIEKGKIFKNAKIIKQLSENNKLKPIIKKYTFKTKLNKNNQNILKLYIVIIITK